MLRFQTGQVLLVLFLWLSGMLYSPAASSGPHIAEVNILLPPKMTHPVDYLLVASDGCFKWSWDHHDILAVMPEYNSTSHCSTSARIRSIAPYVGRKETALYATDVNTGIVIRCKVFIDNISSIKISHNSVKLDLDGLATLRVRGFDDQDNEFSSLVGLKFMWQLSNTNESPHYLAHVPLKDAPLSDCGGLCGDLNIQVKLEGSGVFSDLFVVKGVGIGEEKVSVKLLETGFEYVADSINLNVAEAMLLEPPSPVYVIIGSSLQYILKVIRRNFPQVVTLPSAHHRWLVSNSSVAEVASAMGLVYSLDIGVTSVIVEDTRVSGNMLESSFNVVLPQYITFYFFPFKDYGDVVDGIEAIPSAACWYLIAGHQYVVRVKVYSRGPESHEIYITESDELVVDDTPTEHMKIYFPPNDLVLRRGVRDSRIITAVSRGKGSIKASLRYLNGKDERKKVIRAEQELRICDPVKLKKRNGDDGSILLPWAPNIFQKVTFKATGGCGEMSNDYKWIVADSSILTVPSSGVVMALKPGKTTLKVVSSFDSLNFDEAVVEVTIPSSMMILHKFPVESVTQSYLHPAVTMTAPNGAHFYICDAFHPFIKWMTGNDAFKITNSTEASNNAAKTLPRMGPACSWTHLYAAHPGQTILQAALSTDYYRDDHVLLPIMLKASISIAAYLPLSVHQVGNGNKFGGYSVKFILGEATGPTEKLDELFLVPGTTMDVMLFGGPQPWGKGIEFVETVDVLDENHSPVMNEAAAHPVTNDNRNLYKISCFNHGFFHLVFKRGNLIGDDHPLPVLANVTLALACTLPSSIALIVDEPENTKELVHAAALSGYIDGQVRGAPVAVANDRIIRIAAIGIDSSGKIFSNSSSLFLKWELSGCHGLATWEDTFTSRSAESTWERHLALLNESGECIILVAASGPTTILESMYARTQSVEYSLIGATRIRIVTVLRLNPEFTLLYFSPDAKANLSIIGGTCFLEATVNNSQVIEIFHSPSSLHCSQVVLSPRGQGIANVTVLDVGLTPPVAVSSVVQVADIDWIKIVSEDEINLMEGQSTSMEIMAGTNDGFTYDTYQYEYMKFHVHIDDDIIDVKQNYEILNYHGLDSKTLKFGLTAKHVGTTTVYVTARQQTGLQVISQIIKVEVYATLTISPENIFLVPGAMYKLAVNGGPTTSSNVRYVSLNEEVATVDGESGKISAISPGKTRILSRVYQNSRDIICESFMTVNVGVPSSAELNVQSEQIDVGRSMAIYPRFVEGNLFSFYELCTKYEWSVENDQVICFYNDLECSKQAPLLNNEMELKFYQMLHGRSAGKTQISVSFTCDFVSPLYSQSRSYTASLALSVLATLPVALGSPITWVLPPHYTSSGLLPSSIVSLGDRDGKIQKQTVAYSVMKNCEKNAQQRDSISIDGNTIKTLESGELACIQAKDRTSGRAEIASCVRVAEVYQIRVNSKFPNKRIFLAIGAQISLPITYCDALGNQFHEAHNAIYFDAETNYNDVVEVAYSNNGSDSLYLKGRKHGHALIRVEMSRNSDKVDFVLVSVGAHLHPQNPVLHLGGVLHFSVEGSNNQLNGRWLSSNDSVLSIRTSSGYAEAVGVGTSEVFYDGPGIHLQSSVTVLSGSLLSVDAPKEIVTNVGDSLEGYKFSVKLSDYEEFENISNEKAVPFSCKIEPEFVGYSKPWKDLVTGNFYCLFFPHSPEHLARSISKTKSTRPYLSISITASLRNCNISATSSSLFVGGFSVTETNQGNKKFNLTSHSDEGIITILGNTDVVVHWNERNSLDVRLIERDDYGVGGRARYKIKVANDEIYSFKDVIAITVPATGQKYEIAVDFVPASESKTRLGGTVWSPLFIMIAIFVLVIAALMIILEVSNRSHRRPHARRPPAAPTVTIPVTPERSSAAMTESPGTPKPFIDYVRKTINETPNYRRDARRRFNVQNTL